MAKKSGAQPGNKNAEKWTEEILIEIGNGLIEWLKKKPSNVYFKDYLLFECDHDIPANFIEHQTKKYDSFRDLIKKAKEMQEVKIIKFAGTKVVNPTMGIFFLKNHYDYTDKIENTSKGEIKITDETDLVDIDNMSDEEMEQYEKDISSFISKYTDDKRKLDDKKSRAKSSANKAKPTNKRTKKVPAKTRKKKAS